MDTITNAAKGVTGAIWGTSNNEQSGTEPVSGQTGDTKKGEPYDAGNAETQNEQKTTEASGTSASNAAASSTGPSTGPKQTGSGNTAATGPIRPEHETDKTGVTSAHQPGSASTSEKPSSSNDTSGKGPQPSVGADPASAPQNTQKHQGADRPHESPDSKNESDDEGGENDAIKATKKEAEDADKIDTSGPGPRPLEEKAKQGGGNAGGSEDDDGPQKESHGEGTGEKYIKSSGMKADGGDFNAANAGAGKEADRLLEEKGIHHEPDAVGAPKGREEGEAEEKHEGKEKKGLLTKIKSKIGKKGDKD